MKQKNKIIILIFVLFLNLETITPLMVNASSQLSVTSSVISVKSSEVTPRSDDIRWVYRVIGTQTYRRLFNYTKNVWIGGWEPYP